MKATQHESKLFIKLSRGLRVPDDSVIIAIHKASSLRACVISWIPINFQVGTMEIELTLDGVLLLEIVNPRDITIPGDITPVSRLCLYNVPG